MIIDFHTHCFPDALAARAVAKLSASSDLRIYHNGTAADLSRKTRQAGIDLAVVLPIATKPSQTMTINRWVKNLPESNLLGFGTLHPDFADWADEIGWLKQNGFRGIKLHPEYQQFFVDDEQYFPIYESIFQAGLAIIFHAGEDLAYSEPFHCTPARLARVMDAFPGGRIIAAHMGGYQYWDDVEKYLVGRQVWLDTSFSLPGLGPQRLTAMMRRHGLDRILFGSDAPWTSQSESLTGIQSLDLLPEELAAVLGGNARRLLDLAPESAPPENI